MNYYTKALEFFVENGVSLNHSQKKNIKSKISNKLNENDFYKKLGHSVRNYINNIKKNNGSDIKKIIKNGFYKLYKTDADELLKQYGFRSDKDYINCIKCEQNYNDRGYQYFQIIEPKEPDHFDIYADICNYIGIKLQKYLNQDSYFKNFNIKVDTRDYEEGAILIDSSML